MYSFIIPAYDCEHTLEKCVKSILNQKIKDFEILIINDGSLDCTGNIAKKLMKLDSRIRSIDKENGGVSSARNRGIEEAKGEWLLFIDSDDYYEDCLLEKVNGLSMDDTMIVFNFCHNDTNIRVLPLSNNSIDVKFDNNFVKQYLNGNLGKSIAYSVCNKVFSTKLIKENKIRFSETIAIGEDMCFVLSYLSYCSQIVSIDDVLYHYVIHTSSAMNGIKDYSQHYENTFLYLNQIELKKNKIDKEILNYWALEAMIIIFTNKYVTNMSYKTFKNYYHTISKFSIIQAAGENRKAKGMKRKILSKIISSNNKMLLYCIIKVNNSIF